MCCPICLEEFTKEDKTVVTSCKHTFHKECLEDCMQVTLPQCPLCRKNIVEDLLKMNFKLKKQVSEEQEVVYYGSDDSDDDIPSSPRNRSLLHRMIYGNKPIH
jgi:E3 ubiquitin-protein ligase RHA2